jgi:hypothetical protein
VVLKREIIMLAGLRHQDTQPRANYFIDSKLNPHSFERKIREEY